MLWGVAIAEWFEHTLQLFRYLFLAANKVYEPYLLGLLCADGITHTDQTL